MNWWLRINDAAARVISRVSSGEERGLWDATQWYLGG